MNTTRPDEARTTHPMLCAFPAPGPLVRTAYRDLHLAVNGTPEQKQALGAPATLPRPWEPASCLNDRLRAELWDWLEQVVIWLNTDYTWDLGALVPTCWPHHPHLIHEIAVIADQRRRAGLALTSDALEEWHRYALPAFIDRIKARIKSHCEDRHERWPGRPRHQEHISPEQIQQRHDAYAADATTLTQHAATPPQRPRFGVVDLDSGEIHDYDAD